jgi:hypothetical protein
VEALSITPPGATSRVILELNQGDRITAGGQPHQARSDSHANDPPRSTRRRNRPTAGRRRTGRAASSHTKPIPALHAHDVVTRVMQLMGLKRIVRVGGIDVAHIQPRASANHPARHAATHIAVLVCPGPSALHIRSACSMQSVTTLHKYEQQRYPSRTRRLQPSLAHLRLRLGLAWGYPWDLLVWCGVSTRKRLVDYLFQL